MSGLFITFEGVEGCGKSTQIARLAERLKAEGRSVFLTREPGGPPIAEAIREVILDPGNTAMDSTTELLLYEAARAQHVAEFLRPALERGEIVLCDRYSDSTTAYQGAGRGLPGKELEALHTLATRDLWPDKTFLLDLPVEIGIARARARGRMDRLEQESFDFHTAVRTAFLELAEAHPARFVVLDGRDAVEAIADRIYAEVQRQL